LLLKALQEAKSAEDVVGALFDGPGGSGTFEESEPDTFSRRRDHAQYKTNPRVPSIGIIDNPLGSLYAVGDGDSAHTNLRYDGPGERRTPRMGGALWLDGDRLSSSEIVMSYDVEMRKTPQPLCDMVILDEQSGLRRFALSPDSLIWWLITKHHSTVVTALGHDIPTSMRTVAGVQHTFVDWPDSGTLQPKSIRSMVALLREYGIASEEIFAVLEQFDRFYRAAPEYVTMNPLHVHMPFACIKSPVLMERYLAVAGTIRHHSNELPIGISTLLKLSDDRREDHTTVVRAVGFIESALDILSVSAQDSNDTATMLRQILNSEQLVCALKRAIVWGEYSELYSETNDRASRVTISSPWGSALERFFFSACARQLGSRLRDAELFVFDLRITASDGTNESSADSQPCSRFITDVQRGGLHSVRITVDRDAFLRASDEERYCVFRDALQEHGRILKGDPSESLSAIKPGARGSPKYAEANGVPSSAGLEEPLKRAVRLIQDAFDRDGYVDLEAVLDLYDGGPEALNVELYVTVAREVAGRLVMNIPPGFRELQSCPEDAVLPQPSYALMREALFAKIEDEDFGDQMQDLVRALFEKDKVVRFWDLAIGPERNSAAATKFNQALLESLANLSGNIEANKCFNETFSS
jgi:hypothetical protein